MTRLLLLAAVAVSLAGCRGTCGNQSSLFHRNSCNTAQATPVKYSGVMPPQSFPASYSMPAGTTVTAMPTGGFPMIPPPPVNATELPMPSEVIPPTILPTNPISGGRAVGLPK